MKPSRILVAALLYASASLPATAEILVGVAGPLAGQFAVLGTAMKAGADAAVAAVNASGGINGELLRVVSEDDGCDTKKAADIARSFVAQDVRLVVGHYCSGASLAAATVYNQSSVLMMTPGASQPALTEAGLWNVFRLVGRDDAQAMKAVERIQKLAGDGGLAVLRDEEATNVELGDKLKTLIADAEVVTVKTGTAADPASIATTLASKSWKAIYFAVPPADAGALAVALRSAGVKAQFLGSEALLADTYWTSAGQAGEGTLVTFPSDQSTSPFAKKAIAELQTAGQESGGPALPAYAAVELFASAAKSAGVNDARAMADWLKSGTSRTTSIGEIAFDAKGDLKKQPYVWYRWSNGSYQPEDP